jgi:hypothetical protein
MTFVSVLPCVVLCPQGALCGVWLESGRKSGACVPLYASVTHSGMIITDLDTLVNLAGAWLGPGVCLVQAALQGAAHVNHVVGEAGCPLGGWWLPVLHHPLAGALRGGFCCLTSLM